MNMSNLHDLIVNDRHINYISSELADANNMDMSNPIIQNKIKRTVTDVLEHTYNIFDKSDILSINTNLCKISDIIKITNSGNNIYYFTNKLITSLIIYYNVGFFKKSAF